MSPALVYADLNDVQKAWLKKCGLHVEGLDLPEGVWRVTLVQGSKILMRDLAYGSLSAADKYGRKLAYRAALAYCAGPQRG